MKCSDTSGLQPFWCPVGGALRSVAALTAAGAIGCVASRCWKHLPLVLTSRLRQLYPHVPHVDVIVGLEVRQRCGQVAEHGHGDV